MYINWFGRYLRFIRNYSSNYKSSSIIHKNKFIYILNLEILNKTNVDLTLLLAL